MHRYVAPPMSMHNASDTRLSDHAITRQSCLVPAVADKTFLPDAKQSTHGVSAMSRVLQHFEVEWRRIPSAGRHLQMVSPLSPAVQHNDEHTSKASVTEILPLSKSTRRPNSVKLKPPAASSSCMSSVQRAAAVDARLPEYGTAPLSVTPPVQDMLHCAFDEAEGPVAIRSVVTSGGEFVDAVEEAVARCSKSRGMAGCSKSRGISPKGLLTKVTRGASSFPRAPLS